MKKKNYSKPKIRLKYYLLKTISVFLLIVPLTILMIVNREKYFTKQTSWSMSLGLLVVCVICIIYVLKKELKASFWLTALLLMFWLLKYIVEDLVLIYTIFYIGYLIRLLFIEDKLSLYKRLLTAEYEAKINTFYQRDMLKDVKEKDSWKGSV